ncbi:opioid growth factor receptor-related protein [Bremerella alba]|uniref:Opioid growth factor receptor (OGFr) conserved domain-containing protein n=1 Tax=Bremerella alba TaxID=980252 RepID=A0A7V9A9P7_9BACT|nr:opioid growth factor receptor-related protein [Bremerella alba]MBA2117692.1 hypothetical protein [Bremerella alba]
MTSRVVDFYCHDGTDPYGRSVLDMMALTDRELESQHDIIQWMFPLHETSSVNPDCPLVDEHSRHVLQENIDARQRMHEMITRFARFLGFELNDEGQFISELGLASNRENWHSPMNHNQLRITRVIRSMRLFGFQREAEALFEAVTHSAVQSQCVTERTLAYWKQALEGPLFETLR